MNSQTSLRPGRATALPRTFTTFNKTIFAQLTSGEKQRRHNIFRCLVAELRGERFEENGDSTDLIYDLPKLEYSRNFGLLNNDELFKLGVCAIPNFILNALVCEKLTKRFGDLSICGCFFRMQGMWRLDIDENLSRNGLFLPLRTRQDGLIYGLRVFNHPDSQRSFVLKLRRQNHG